MTAASDQIFMDVAVPLDSAAAEPALPQRFHEPVGFVWGEQRSDDGDVLRWGHLPARQPRIDCVLVGGFTEFIEKYFETIGDLAARGISVWALDWRGQGGSTRPDPWPTRPRRRDYDRDAADLAAFAGRVLDGSRPRLLIGHSMGGAISLLALHSYPGLVDAAVLSAPMLGLAKNRIPEPLGRFLASWAVMWGLGSFYIPGAKRWSPGESIDAATSRTTSDPVRAGLEHAWFEARPSLQVDGPTYGWVAAAFRLVDRLSDERLLGAIRTPVLIGAAGTDTIVDSGAQRRAAGFLPDCTLVELTTSKHEPFCERDEIRDAWFKAIDAFVARRLDPR